MPGGRDELYEAELVKKNKARTAARRERQAANPKKVGSATSFRFEGITRGLKRRSE